MRILDLFASDRIESHNASDIKYTKCTHVTSGLEYEPVKLIKLNPLD